MRPATLMTCLWPGLAPLWWRGAWQGLVQAVAFGLGLNLLLTLSLVWPEWIGPRWIMPGWLLLGAVWLVASWRSWRQLPTLLDGRPDGLIEALFTQAQAEYLKGNWYDAQKLLERLLMSRPRDAEAHLLLATIFRHTGQRAEAERRLAQLERLDGGRRWQLEIAQERQRLKRLAEEEGRHGTAAQQSPALEEPPRGASQAA